MSTWHVYYTELAQHDMEDIFEYIALTLLVPDSARSQVDRILDSADALCDMPYRYEQYEDEPWRSRGLRRFPVDNYVVFYLPIEAHMLVAIVRVMYVGSDIRGKLRVTPMVD